MEAGRTGLTGVFVVKFADLDSKRGIVLVTTLFHHSEDFFASDYLVIIMNNTNDCHLKTWYCPGVNLISILCATFMHTYS